MKTFPALRPPIRCRPFGCPNEERNKIAVPQKNARHPGGRIEFNPNGGIMRNILFSFISFLILLPIFGFADTIPNTTGDCLGNKAFFGAKSLTTSEVFNIELVDDSLSFSGIIRHNCCGGHFLISNISMDTIHFARLDTGMECMCDCPFPFSVKIYNLSLSQYHIILIPCEVNNGRGLDTLVLKSPSKVIPYDILKPSSSLRCLPNPANNSVIIRFNSFHKTGSIIHIYDINGRNIKVLKQTDPLIWKWNTTNVTPGIYFIQYQDNTINVFTKLVINN
jgi:hypothetical protein